MEQGSDSARGKDLAGDGKPTAFEAFCPSCGEVREFASLKLNHWKYLGLSVITLGFGAGIWVLAVIGKILRPWRCQTCGWHQPELIYLPKDTTPHAAPASCSHGGTRAGLSRETCPCFDGRVPEHGAGAAITLKE